MPETFPTPAALSGAAADALGGTTHERTQIDFIPLGIDETSTPTLYQRLNMVQASMLRALAGIAAGMAFKTDTLEIGVLPLHYRKSDGTAVQFLGGTLALTASETNNVYIDHATNTLATSITGWPADITTFTPIAEYVCGGSDITTDDDDADRRGLQLFQTNSSSTSPTGTTGTAFTLDSDNAGAGADQQVRFNRGSTDAEDAAIEWDETADRFDFMEQHTSATMCPINASELQISGTAMVDANGAAKVAAAVAGDGLAHAAGVLSVGVDDSTIEIDTDALRLKASGIATSHLGDTLADKLVQISVGDASGASPQTVTIQAKDIQGNNLAEVIYVEVAVFDDADGTTPAVNATIADGGAGAVVRAVTANKDLICKTDGTGLLEIAVTDGTAETVYLLVKATFRSRIMDCADYGTVVIS